MPTANVCVVSTVPFSMALVAYPVGSTEGSAPPQPATHARTSAPEQKGRFILASRQTATFLNERLQLATTHLSQGLPRAHALGGLGSEINRRHRIEQSCRAVSRIA